MLTFYRPRKWALPALASKSDLLLLEEIQKRQHTDGKNMRKLNRLIYDFHQTNYSCTIGGFAGLSAAVFLLYVGFDDLIHPAKNALVLIILIASDLMFIPFCGLIRLLGMWFVRRKFCRLK